MKRAGLLDPLPFPKGQFFPIGVPNLHDLILPIPPQNERDLVPAVVENLGDAWTVRISAVHHERGEATLAERRPRDVIACRTPTRLHGDTHRRSPPCYSSLLALD